jgi:hypothetical protein
MQNKFQIITIMALNIVSIDAISQIKFFTDNTYFNMPVTEDMYQSTNSNVCLDLNLMDNDTATFKILNEIWGNDDDGVYEAHYQHIAKSKGYGAS